MTLMLFVLMVGMIGIAALISGIALRYVGDGRRRDEARAALLRDAATTWSMTTPQPVADQVSSLDQFAVEGANDAPAVDVMFGTEARPPAAPAQRWIAPAVAVIVVALITATVFARRGDAPSEAKVQPAKTVLLLTSLSESRDAAGTLIVSGAVENPPNAAALDHLMVVVDAIDAAGRKITTVSSGVETTVLPGGNASRFVVEIPQSTQVARYRVGFRLPTGTVVAHRDGRAAKAGA